MKKYRTILWIMLLALAVAGCGGNASENAGNEEHASDPGTEEVREPEEEKVQAAQSVEAQPDMTLENVYLYGSFQGIYGCAVIYDPQEGRYSFYHRSLAEQRTSPYSTFKIVSALAGLENLVVEDKDSTMNYDGNLYPVAEWNGDLTLEEAFRSSCVWYFRQVVDAVGEDEMKAELEALQYGNCDISQWEGSGVNKTPELNGFWLDSSLEISPLEQVQVLARIFEGQSGYDEENIAVLKELMLTEDDGVRKIYGKTGSGHGGKAWFAGFEEEADHRKYFAVYLDDGYRQEEVSSAKAKEIAAEVLEDDRGAAGAEDTEIYRAFVEKNYPQGIVSTLLADLTGDGRQELIVIKRLPGEEPTQEAAAPGELQENESVSMAVYMIKDDARVVSLYEDYADSAHAGWNWLYLYEEAGRSYLFRYLPVVYQGMGSYSYDIFSLTEEGEEVLLYSAKEPVDVRGGELSEEFQKRITKFLEQVRIYQEESIPLVEIGEDYFHAGDGFDGVRTYHYVIDSDELGLRK